MKEEFIMRIYRIVTSQAELSRAEKFFMDMVNDKESDNRDFKWYCVSHRYSNINKKLKRIYLFEREDGLAEDLLILETDPDIIQDSDYLISFGLKTERKDTIYL